RAGIADALFRMTAACEQPLRLKWESLDVSEQVELVELARACDSPSGLRLGDLPSRKRTRFEVLASKAAGHDSNYFEQRREEERLRAGFAELLRQTKLPPRRVRYEEAGSVRLPQSVFAGLDNGGKNPVYTLPTLGLLVLLLGSFENAKAVTPRGYV